MVYALLSLRSCENALAREKEGRASAAIDFHQGDKTGKL